jgi:hypothetical protein
MRFLSRGGKLYTSYFKITHGIEAENLSSLLFFPFLFFLFSLFSLFPSLCVFPGFSFLFFFFSNKKERKKERNTYVTEINQQKHTQPQN